MMSISCRAFPPRWHPRPADQLSPAGWHQQQPPTHQTCDRQRLQSHGLLAQRAAGGGEGGSGCQGPGQEGTGEHALAGRLLHSCPVLPLHSAGMRPAPSSSSITQGARDARAPAAPSRPQPPPPPAVAVLCALCQLHSLAPACPAPLHRIHPCRRWWRPLRRRPTRSLTSTCTTRWGRAPPSRRHPRPRSWRPLASPPTLQTLCAHSTTGGLAGLGWRCCLLRWMCCLAMEQHCLWLRQRLARATSSGLPADRQLQPHCRPLHRLQHFPRLPVRAPAAC